jgi:microcin C transport system permease protein
MSMLHPSTWLDPVTRKRLRRFREMRRAWWSLWILLIMYGLSLMAELLCNDKPLAVRFDGRWYFPVVKFYPENTFTDSGRMTRPDYKELAKNPVFAEHPENRMVWPLIPYSPLESIRPERILLPKEVKTVFIPEARVGTVDLRNDGSLTRPVSAGFFFGREDGELDGLKLADFFELPAEFQAAVQQRFANNAAPSMEREVTSKSGNKFVLALSSFRPRAQPPRTVRLTLRESGVSGLKPSTLVFSTNLTPVVTGGLWPNLQEETRQQITEGVKARFEGSAEELNFMLEGRPYRVRFDREEIRFPFRPVAGHPFGLDSSGRDVLARLFYGLRTSMTFGILLVMAAMILGTLIGAVQGYYGGRVDLIGQRTIEIWESLPFLYIMILLGSIYGQSFILLLIVYGIFNWIGISYYMRAEFLRLRKLPFVEAARCMGLPSRKIIFRHILPNALVPLITFFPFLLVGAIGSLAALDYLGFGLPPPTPSWGELLSQAQEFSRAWWLVLYPFLALFVVMLLGAFVGEGVRSAFDPRRASHLE